MTGGDQSALGGVYKVSATRAPLPNGDGFGEWRSRIKISDDLVKISTPGIQGVRRFYESDDANALAIADAIYDIHDETLDWTNGCTVVDPSDPTRRKSVTSSTRSEDLLVPVLRNGKEVYQSPALKDIRDFATQQRARLHPAIRRFVNPHRYPAGLEQSLHERKMQMVLDAKS